MTLRWKPVKVKRSLQDSLLLFNPRGLDICCTRGYLSRGPARPSCVFRRLLAKSIKSLLPSAVWPREGGEKGDPPPEAPPATSLHTSPAV